MPRLKIAIHLPSLGLPLRKGAELAARLGAGAIVVEARGELSPQTLGGTGLRAVRGVLAELELKVAAVTFPTRRGYGDEDELDRRMAGCKTAMKFAYDLGASVVISGGGVMPEADATGWEVLVGSLLELGRHADRVGARVALPAGHEPPDVLAKLLAALPPQSVGVDFDPATAIMKSLSPLEIVQRLGEHMLHVFARDAVRDLSRRRGIETPLGRGSADFPALLAALEERGYRGYFTVARQDADDPADEIGAAVRYLSSV